MKKKVGGFWKDRKYLDWWSIVHLVFGLVFALVLKAIGLELIFAFLITAVVFVFWEIVEPKVCKSINFPYEEKFPNSFLDVVVGLVGFFIGWFPEREYVFILIISLLLILFMARIIYKLNFV